MTKHTPCRSMGVRLSKNALSYENVGASIARPPKIFDFRIFRRKITVFSPCGDRFCFGKICGRPTPQGGFSCPCGQFTFWSPYDHFRQAQIPPCFGRGVCYLIENQRTKEVLRVVDQASPGSRMAAWAFSSHLRLPPSKEGRLCQGSMQTNLGIPFLDQIRV